ncbi:MAG TPA: hypothetical protein P5234_10395 [Thermoanaerobaculaceae bacterium]|nr:hypothetical protein [Thermoanaerobaculaceae bacterium]HRS16637.1 hypothetical protein [Thermoanaerobaculaceae bacterium]
MRIARKLLMLSAHVAAVWAVTGAGSALAQGTPAPEARPRVPGKEVRVGDTVLFWRAPVELPGLDAIAVAPGEGGAVKLTVTRQRGTGHLKLVRQEGPWPAVLELELKGFETLASFSVCDGSWCAESSLGGAPDTAVTPQGPARDRPAPIVRTAAAVQDDRIVATMPLDWVGEASGALTVRWAEQAAAQRRR